MGYKIWEEALAANYKTTVSWRRQLHENPEPSFEEYETRKYIADKLKSFGMKKLRKK